MDGAIERCITRRLHVNTILDIGAADGGWSKMCMEYIPNANYMLIEALKEHEENLKTFCNNNSNACYIISAASDKNGEVFFKHGDLAGGSAAKTAIGNDYLPVRAITIDNVVARNKIQSPFLLKLDTHGFEIPILEGAEESINNANLVIIEAYNYQLTSDSLKFYELCSYMESKGFRVIELIDLCLRPYDKSLWQCDIFFVPESHTSFAYNKFS